MTLDSRERAIELIKRADEVETICLLAIVHVITGEEVACMREQPKATLKRAIKRLREAQARHPEIAEFETAIQYIYLRRRRDKKAKNSRLVR